MTVEQLIEQLLRCNLEDEVVIGASYTFITAGPSPYAPVTHISKGGDWNKGKVFIGVEPHLVQLNDHQYNEFCKEIREHDWIRYDIYCGKKPRGTIPPMFNPKSPEEQKDD